MQFINSKRKSPTPPAAFRGKPILARSAVQYDDGEEDGIVLIQENAGFVWYYALSPYIPMCDAFETEAEARKYVGLQ